MQIKATFGYLRIYTLTMPPDELLGTRYPFTASFKPFPDLNFGASEAAI